MSTGMENGVAIPHCSMDEVDDTLVALGVSSDGIDFESIDGQPTQHFFLLVVPERDDNAWRSVRNLPRVAMMVAADVNAYEVLRHHALIFVGDAMDQLAARVGQAHTEFEA